MSRWFVTLVLDQPEELPVRLISVSAIVESPTAADAGVALGDRLRGDNPAAQIGITHVKVQVE